MNQLVLESVIPSFCPLIDYSVKRKLKYKDSNILNTVIECKGPICYHQI